MEYLLTRNENTNKPVSSCSPGCVASAWTKSDAGGSCGRSTGARTDRRRHSENDRDGKHVLRSEGLDADGERSGDNPRGSGRWFGDCSGRHCSKGRRRSSGGGLEGLRARGKVASKGQQQSSGPRRLEQTPRV